MTRRRIAIVGAGPAALATAFHLTNVPGWEEHFEIVLFAPGHRAGGKATTARGPHARVEELGIHILQGWYENTFRILRAAYRERRERDVRPRNEDAWHEAIEKDTTTFLTTRVGDETRWSSWTLVFPQDDLLPGTDEPVPVARHLRRLVALGAHFALGSPWVERRGALGAVTRRTLARLFRDEPVRSEGPPPFREISRTLPIDERVRRYIDEASYRLDDNREIPLAAWQARSLRFGARAFRRPWHRVRRAMVARATRGSNLETTWQAIDWLYTSAAGSLEDAWVASEGKLVFSRMNDEDYRAWLQKHGAHPATLESGLVKFMYYGSFANRAVGGAEGTLAADIAVRMVLNTLFYKGSLVWKTKKGSGTSMIVPIVQVLRARGVRFRFFHRLIDAVPSERGTIDVLRFAEDVRLRAGLEEYDPIVDHGGDPDFAPSPDATQLDPADAARLADARPDLASSLGGWIPAATHELREGRDFDDVVLAIPVSAIASACPTLLAKDERWRRMVRTVPCVATFAAQLWLRPTQRELGYRHEEWGVREEDEPNSVIYEDPVYSWTDMTRILREAERWPDDDRAPHTLAYFCGTLPDEPIVQPGPGAADAVAAQRANVVRLVRAWLDEHMAWFWPRATKDGRLDRSLLVVPDERGQAGDARFAEQFFSVNADPANLYVLARPGTDAARLRADDSGYANLFLAGDWTDFGLNVGHLEGACVSGIRAAIAVLRGWLRRERPRSA